MSFEIAAWGDTVTTGKIVAILLSKHSVDFGARPNVKPTFLALRIGIERSTKGAFRSGHLADEPIEGFLGTLQKQRFARMPIGEGEQFQDLGIVIEHFFKMRNQPFLIDRVSREASSQMVIDAALAHVLKGKLYKVKQSRLASARASAPKQFKQGALREFRCLAESAVSLIECPRDGDGGRVQFSSTDHDATRWSRLGC